MKKLLVILGIVILLGGNVWAAGEISSLTAQSDPPATGDLMEIVDVSDTTMAATGTNKKITAAQLFVTTVPVSTTSTVSGLLPTVIDSDGTIGVSTAQATAGTLFLNTYAGTAVMTLPAAAAGMSVCLRNGQGVNQILQVHSDGTDYLVLPATGARNTAANHFAATASPTNQICLVAYDTTDWYILSTVGTWAAE